MFKPQSSSAPNRTGVFILGHHDCHRNRVRCGDAGRNDIFGPAPKAGCDFKSVPEASPWWRWWVGAGLPGRVLCFVKPSE